MPGEETISFYPSGKRRIVVWREEKQLVECHYRNDKSNSLETRSEFRADTWLQTLLFYDETGRVTVDARRGTFEGLDVLYISSYDKGREVKRGQTHIDAAGNKKKQSRRKNIMI